MNKPTYLSIIVPVHNEERRISDFLNEMLPHAKQYYHEIIFVNNGSTDATEHVLDTARSMYSSIQVMTLDERGKGAAVRAGMLQAVGRYRYMCDVDLSTPAMMVHEFLRCALKRDVVIGSREVLPRQTQTTSTRRFIGRTFHRLVHSLVPGVFDTQCGFKMFRDYAAQSIFERVTITGMAFDVQVLHLAQSLGYSIEEMSVPWVHDPNSRVRLVDDSLEMLLDVIRLKLRTVSKVGEHVQA